MPATALDHYTLNCADLTRTRDFYRDILGLKDGYRPPFGFAGHWLYCNALPVVHLLSRDPASSETTGRVDHIAFTGVDVEAMRAVLAAQAIPYTENRVPKLGSVQIFVTDPDGLKVELNFRDAV